MVIMKFLVSLLLSAGVGLTVQTTAQRGPASTPPQGTQYNRLVVRNAMMISGRGTPAQGPVDMIIERDTIADIVPVDGVSLSNYGPNFKRAEGDRVIDATGMYVLPGLVDMHAHIPGDGERSGPRGFEYGYKLWLAHGVTTLRDPGNGAGLETLADHRRRVDANDMVAPRLLLYQRWPNYARRGEKGHTPDEARALVRKFKEQGADGIKVSTGPGHYPDVLAAICDEARKLGMGVAVDLKVSETDAVIAAKAGVTSLEHWYGVPDAAIAGTQGFPPNYNYLDELDRFRYAGKLWKEAAQSWGKVREVLDTMLKHNVTWDPTLVVYEKNRDLTRAINLPWHRLYTHPALIEYWAPNPGHHGSYHFDWKTSDESSWRENFQHWMRAVREFWEMGGRVTVGSDAGSSHTLYGFSTIRELELMDEAGFKPIDIIQLATTNATQALGLKDVAGVRSGYKADLIVVDGNPLDNFKVLYGTGYETVGRDGKTVHRGGVRWTIRNGAVFDAQALLRDVEEYVRQSKQR